MRILLANHSSYPGGSSDAELTRVLGEQARAGLDLMTDGQLGWADPITPLFGALDGVRLGGAITLPGIAGSFRRPVIQAKLRRHAPLCLERFRRAAAVGARPLKAVLTGPYTLAQAAEIATTAYRSADQLADEISALLAQEVAALADAGAPAVQIDEPLIVHRPHDIRRLRELLEPMYDAAGGRAQMIVATYGLDAAALYAQLNSLPADVIAVDCAGRPAICDAIAETGSGKPLALGIVDAASALEDPVRVAHLCERLLRRYIHPTVWLQPARGLAALTAAQAQAKLALLEPVRAQLRPGL
jgi:5-methyltetrahydropteroyltriglutamate--homocysteine methyltransferase